MMKRILVSTSLIFGAIFLGCVISAAIESVRPGTMHVEAVDGNHYEQKLVDLVNSTK